MNQLTVGEVADALGLSVDTIRRWDKKGLIKSTRDSNNYRLFSLDEVRRVHEKYMGTSSGRGFYVLDNEPTDFTSIELFAGAGGMALGFENAGFQSLMLNEVDKYAAETLRINRSDWYVIEDDVRQLEFAEYEGQVDVVAGGFPCQAFSYAGHSRGFDDTRGTLFFDFARCVKQVRPKIALGENVRGLVRHDKGRTLKTMVKVLEDLGYRVEYRVLKAQFHDVPQKRERLILIGVREDLDMSIYFPKENNYILSLREAFTDIPQSDGASYPKRKEEILSHVPAGGYWKDLPEDLAKEYMKKSYYLGGGKTGMARRLAWEEPSLTLTCSPAQKQTERCHPEETRPLTVREYARLQTFPDDWGFSGSVSQQYKQIGNAVPVNLAYHVGRCLIGMLEGTVPENGKLVVQEDGANTTPQQLSLF
ncbi:MAG: DNA (cytosine-5-)-methyltransferase [Chloroflexota bacterium]